MKKKMSRILAAALVGVMSISLLAGCGGSDQGASNEGNANTENAGAENAGAGEAEATGEEVVLTFPCIWVGEDSKAEVFGQMVTSFNEEYDGQYQINIEEQTDYDAYQDYIRTNISTGSAPDLFTVKTQADVKYYSESGKIMDLTEFLAGDVAANFVPGAVDAAKLDGVNYAVPYEMAYIPVMYNQKLLDAAGATVPTSFEELWETCDKLKASGVTPMCQMTANNAWTSMLWYSYALAACGGPDVFEKGFEDPAYAQAAELVKKMYEYTSSDAVGADASVVNGHFFTEDTAIYTNGTWILGRINSDEANEGLYDNLTMGGGLSNGGQNGNSFVSYCQAYIMAAKQDDPAKQAAVEAFLAWITNPEKVTELANSSGALFAINMDETALTDAKAIETFKLRQNCDFAIGSFEASVSTSVANAFPAALESLVLGDISAEEFVEYLIAADVE